MKILRNEKRRKLLKVAGIAGGGLLLRSWWPVPAAAADHGVAGTEAGAQRAAQTGAPAGARAGGGQSGAWLTAWVRITPDNRVTLIVSQAEMGQGISTTLPALLADELGADWDSVRLETPGYAKAYENPERNWMFTGNSESSQAFHDHVRKMGAAAREMLIQAAAARWNVSPARCRTRASYVEL